MPVYNPCTRKCRLTGWRVPLNYRVRSQTKKVLSPVSHKQVAGSQKAPSRMTEKPYSLTAYQIRLLVVLVLINFVNFAARQVFVPLIPLLRVHLNVTDADLGAMQTWLLLVLALASVPFGYFADRVSRKAIIWIGILCWSLATLAGGLASTFVSFLIARAFVGLGEAAYAPAAQSMISGAFPKERTSRTVRGGTRAWCKARS